MSKSTTRVRARAAVSTRTRVAIAVGAMAVAAAAIAGSFVLGKGSVKIVSPLTGSPFRGTVQFDAKVTPPSGYDIFSVTFTELPEQRSYNAAFSPVTGLWRAAVDTTQLKKGPHSMYAQAVFVARPRSTPTATRPLTLPSTVTATATSGKQQIVTRSAYVSFSVNNETADAASPINVRLSPVDAESAPGYVIGGTSNVTLAKFNFSAREEVQIRKLRFSSDTPNAVRSLSLYSGSTLVGGPVAPDASGVAQFSNLNIRIVKNGVRPITVKGNLAPVGPAGVLSGASARLTLSGATGAFEAIVLPTNQTVTAFVNLSSLAGPYKNLKKSLPTVSIVGLPSTLLNSGDQVAQRFSIAANAAGDIATRGLTFEINNRTGAALDPALIGVRRVGNASNIPATVRFQSTCGAGANCKLFVKFTSEEVVAAGTTRTYDLRVRIASARTGDALSTTMLGDIGYARGPLSENAKFLGYLVGGAQSHFTWSDLSAVPHDPAIGASSDWGNGIYVKTLPTQASVMSR